MLKNDNYEKIVIKVNQRLIKKLIYWSCNIRPNITFTIR